jgi:hypothetical protein
MDNVYSLTAREIRAMDTNSLLRLYDQVKEVFDYSLSPQERAKAEKPLQRLAEELRRRDVQF